MLLGVPADRVKVWEALPLVEGEPCREDDEILLAADLAKTLGVEVGDRLTLVARRPRNATIVGLVNAQSLRDLRRPRRW